MIRATLHMKVRPGAEDEFMRVFSAVAERVRHDPGSVRQTLLRDPDWSQWSYREIGRRCHVSHDFVRKVAERHGLTGRASTEE